MVVDDGPRDAVVCANNVRAKEDDGLRATTPSHLLVSEWAVEPPSAPWWRQKLCRMIKGWRDQDERGDKLAL